MEINIENLLQTPLFKGLKENEIEQITANVNLQVKRFPAKSTVLSQGEECNFLMIVLAGTVQGQMLDFSGKLIVIEEIPAGRLLAPAFIYADKNELPVNIVAVKDCEIIFIHKSEFTTILQQNKVILQNFLTLISNRSKFLSEKIMFLNFKNLKSKIAAFLLQKYREQQTTHLTISETQQQLADFFGVARPSLARVLKEMKDERLIEINKKNIVLLDLNELAKESE